jgi:D-inositol-3-phosphate glycosyltransferase
MSGEQATYASPIDHLPSRARSARAPRVLIISGQSGGGIWQYACLLSEALHEAGVEVALATTFPFEPVEGVGLTVPIWQLGTPPGTEAHAFLEGPRRVISQIAKLSQLRRLVARFNPHIVHLQDRMGYVDFLYLRLLKRLGVRVVLTAHDPRPLTGAYVWSDRARYREADAIFVHSGNGVRELLAAGVEARKITQIVHPNYLHFCRDHTLSRDEARRALGIPLDTRAILFFGMISAYKGLDVLLRAFSDLSRADARTRLIIAGDPLEAFRPYQHLIDQLGIGEGVHMDLRRIPFDEFAKFFRAADVVALPYRRVHQSGILQLAYGFGRPVVVTAVGGLSEAVTEDRTGLIVPPEDPHGLADALQRLLAAPDVGADMGARARHLAETRYSWAAVAEQIVAVYRSLLASAR